MRGDAPSISAVMPEGVLSSAHETTALPPRRRKAPMMACSLHWAAVGQGAPRSFRKAKRRVPAIANLIPAMRKGGRVSTATRIPR